MSKKESTPSNGKISLWYKSWESASGHAETEDWATLSAKSGEVLVLETCKSSAQFIGNCYNRSQHDNYEISISEIIEFIKSHGEKIE